ncbi:MAG: helix-turn-helix domain-containing protein [Lachnospiraceae bacterium]|nr:helix-turn-helix domain-containing protein [Lachnospiraceae bacterium]
MIKNKSYFPRIFRDFLLTLLVPIIALALLYLQAGNTIEEQILLSNKNTLNQFFELIDTTLSEMRWTGYSIANHKKCREYSLYAAKGNDRLTYQVKEIIQVLEDAVNDKYYDLLIYYPGNGRIISGVYGSMNWEDYCSVYYSGEECEKQFGDILECNTKGASLYMMKQEGKEPLLCIAMRKKNVGDHAKDYVVVQIIDPKYLNKIMTEMYQPEDGVLLIFDEKEKLLISGDNREEYHMDGYIAADMPYEIKINNNKYMMQVQQAKSVPGYYAVAIDAKIFWEKLSELRIICIVGGLACAVISIYIAWRGSKRTYSPLWNIVNHIEEYNLLQYDAEMNSEVEFINKIFEKEVNERRYLDRKEKADKLDSFIISLLYGDVSVGAGEDAFIENGISLCSDRFSVVVMSVVKTREMESDLQAFAIKNIFEELYNQGNRGYLVRTADNQFVSLINIGEALSTELLSDVLLEGQKFVREHLNIIVTIAVGDIHEGMAEIPMSYKEAREALRYKYLFGEESCIQYSQIKARELNYSVSGESRLSKMVIGYMKDSSPAKSAEQFVRELLEMYGINEQASMDTVECFKYEMLSIINKAVMSNKGVFDNYKESVEELILQPTLEKFREKFIDVLTKLWEKERESIEQEDICNRVRSYILEHYREPELSVNMLGDKMRISTYYLSKLFKAKYDISIPDYISQTRIRSAKDDLKNTSKNIKQIAEENGFLSSTVFINTFKKWEGITPGIYRKLK